MYTNFDSSYKQIAHDLCQGHFQQSRNGYTVGQFNVQHTYHGWVVPILGLRKINLGLILKELKWIISGSSDINELGSHKFIWEPWADSNGQLMSSYGRLLRHFPSTSGSLGLDGLDQIASLKSQLMSDTPSRRIQLTLAHPDDLALSDLPPCMSGLGLNWFEHLGSRKVCLNIKFRSSDFCVGFPFDILQWYLFTQLLLADVNQEKPGANYVLDKYSFSADNQHIYICHLDQLRQLVERPETPLVHWLPEMAQGTLENFKFDPGNAYQPHKPMPFNMVA